MAGVRLVKGRREGGGPVAAGSGREGRVARGCGARPRTGLLSPNPFTPPPPQYYTLMVSGFFVTHCA